jgi:hypothetical protein
MLELISVPTLFLASAITQGLLGISCWLLLRHRHDRARLTPWMLGGLASGAWIALLGGRGSVPDWASYELGNSLAYASTMLTFLALRRETGPSPGRGPLVLLWLGLTLIYFALGQFPDPLPRFAFSAVVLMTGSLVNAHAALQASRSLASRSGLWLAGLLWTWAAVIALRLLLALAADEVTQPPNRARLRDARRTDTLRQTGSCERACRRGAGRRRANP